MKKYDLFNLYVVEFDGIKYICERNIDDNQYNDIFIIKKFNKEDIENIQPLSDYYEILVMKSYLTDEKVYLFKDELLLKFLKINSYNLYKENRNNCVDNIIKKQKEYLELFKELSIKNPEKAKEIARKSLQRSGILDENGELKVPYDEVFVEENTKKLIKESN